MDRRGRFELAVPGTHQGTRGGTPNYNNVNFYALCLLVEEVTGERLADVLRQDLIDPAGLDRVWVQTAERPAPPLAVAASQRGIVVVDPDGPYLPSRALASAAGAAGGMVADAPTLARWGHQLYAGDLLDAQLVEQMTTAEGEGDWYGLGTMLVGTADEPVVGHEGDLGVYHSLLAVWPDSGVSVAVLVPSAPPRTSEEDRTPWGLAQTLHDAADG